MRIKNPKRLKPGQHALKGKHENQRDILPAEQTHTYPLICRPFFFKLFGIFAMILFQSVHLEQYLAVAVENWATVGDGAFCRRDLHARDSWSPVGKSAGSPARSNAPGALTNTTNWRDLLFPSGLSQLRTHRAASKLPSDAAAAAVLKASITEAANFDQAKISQALQALRARYKPQTQEATRCAS